MSGSSRKDSGTGSKSRYQSLNLVHNYKGASHDVNKGAQKRGSMQSLGKIASTARRMPAPAQLRSLKSSNDGQDPSVTLVPQGGGGWSKDDEKVKEKEDPLDYTRKTEKPVGTAVPERFKENFPSFKEQEEMTKRERDELERRQREEACGDEESRESPPPAPPTSSRNHHSRKQPKETWGGQDAPTYQHGMGQQYNTSQQPGTYPHRQDMYRQSYPPRAGVGKYHQPDPHQQYRPYPPQPHPHNYPPPMPPPYIDPYTLPLKDTSNMAVTKNERPNQFSTDDSERQLEDDEGWAGHQEEVDYSKEVVFEDSSDEESPKKGNKESKEEIVRRNGKQKEHPPGSDRQSSEGFPVHHNKRNIPVEQRTQRRQNTHNQHGGHSPYPYDYQQQSYHYQQQGWYPYQQRGGAPYRQGQHNTGKHQRTEQDDVTNRSNRRHHAWESEGGLNWSNKRDDHLLTEKGVSHGDVSKSPPISHETDESPSELLDPGIDNRVHSPSIPSPDVVVSNTRNYPKKIMMRDFGDKSSGRGDHQQSTTRSGDGEDLSDQKSKVAWGKVKTGSPHLPLETNQEDYPVPVQSSNEPPSYVPSDRGSVVKPKTLYEPEGRTSQEKFRKYQRSMSGGGTSGEHTHGKHRTPSNKSDTVKESDADMDTVGRQDDDRDHVFVEDEKKRMIKRNDEHKNNERDTNDPPLKEKGWKNENRKDREGRGSGRYREDERRGSDRIERGENLRRGSQKNEPSRQEFDRRQDSDKFHANQRRRTEDNQDIDDHRPTSRPRNKHDNIREQESDKNIKYSSRNDLEDKQDQRGGGGPRRNQRNDNRARPGRQDYAHDQDNRYDTRTPPHSKFETLPNKEQRGNVKSKHEQISRQLPPNQEPRGPKPDTRTANENQRSLGRRGTHDNTSDVTGRRHENVKSKPGARPDPASPRQEPAPSRQDPVQHQQVVKPDTKLVPHSQAQEVKQGSKKPNQGPRQDHKQESKREPVTATRHGVRQGSRQDSISSRDLRQESKHEPLPPKVKQDTDRSQRTDPKKTDGRDIERQKPKHVNKEDSGFAPEEKDNDKTRSLNRKKKPLPSESDQDLEHFGRQSSKRPLSTREREDRGQGYRGGRGRPRGYNDEFEEEVYDKVPSRRNNHREEEIFDQQDRGYRGGRGRPRGCSDEFEDKKPSRRNNRREEEIFDQQDRIYRGGRGKPRGYDDEFEEGVNDKVSLKRNNRREGEEVFDQQDHYISRTFDRSKRGGGRGRDYRRGGKRDSRGGNPPDKKKGAEESSRKSEEVSTAIYPDLDDIDSLSDWDDDEGTTRIENDKPPENKKRLQEDDVFERSKQDRFHGRLDQSRRGRGQDRGRRGRRYPRVRDDPRGQTQQTVPSSQNKKESGDKFCDKTEALCDESPTKDYNFDKYDINAHNVYVMDRRSSYSDGEVQSPGVSTEEGFIEVKSKRDKQKDREERRRVDGPQQKKGEEYSGRPKGSSGRAQEHGHNGGKVWGQKKVEPLSREGNTEEWPINEGRSAYGAVGDKPSRERGANTTDLQKTAGLNPNSGYKLFETDKGKTGPFTFDSPIATTPRKGDRLQAAIDITLPSSPQITTSFDNERSSNPIINQQSIVNSNPSTKVHQSSTKNVPVTSSRASKDQRSKNVGSSEDSHGRVGGTKTDNRSRKSKSEQKYYTPPGARHDDRTGPTSKDQRSHSSKHISSSRTKVHHEDLDETVNVEEEEQKQSKMDGVKGVYLRRHQDADGHLILVGDKGDKNVSGEMHDDQTPFNTIRNNNNNNTALKGLGSIPQSSTKFGSVSYASALKRQGQSDSQEGVDDNAITLLSPCDLGGHDTSLYSGESVNSVTEIINDGAMPLHGVLDSVLPDSDDEDGRGSTHGYSPSQRQSDDNVKNLYTVSGNPMPLSPSGQFSKTFSPPVKRSPSNNVTIAKPSSLYSNFGDSGVSGGVEPAPTFPNANDELEHGGVSSQSVKKLLQEETRPSSAQSLTDSSYSRFSKTSYAHLTDGMLPATISGKIAGGPITRVSSAPSHLPLNVMDQEETRDLSGEEEDDNESVKTDDSVSTNSKSMLNIAANEFVPNRQLNRKKVPHRSKDQQHSKLSRGYQGQRGKGGNASVHNHKGHVPHGKIHHNHFHHQQQQQQQSHHHHHHHHSSQQPHPPQQQPLINKPPIDILLQFIMNASLHQQNLKNVPSNLLLPVSGGIPPSLPIPTVPLSTPQTLSHPSLPLSYPPPMSSSFPYQMTHPHPGVLSQSLYHRKMSSQEGVPHGIPHHASLPNPSAPTMQYLPAGSKGPIAPEGSPEMSQVPTVIPSVSHPSYYSATPLHPNKTPQVSAVLVPPHPVQVHHLPSTRPSHVPPPINITQVPVPSLKLPRPVVIEQQSNSNSRPPLLPTPPGFNLVHQTSATVTPSVTTPPSLHHPSWSVHPQAIRLGLPPNIQ